MSPVIFRFYLVIGISLIFSLHIFSQQLDTTFVGFNGDNRIIFIDTDFGGFQSKTWGLRGFLRPDQSIVQLVYHSETFGKGTDPIGTMTASFSPDGGGLPFRSVNFREISQWRMEK